MTITENDIRAELSYAYLHAVASHAGVTCSVSPRTVDALGIDAEIIGREQFDPNSVLEEVNLQIQLKATSQKPSFANGKYSFSLELEHYNQLRSKRIVHSKLLVVLYLPEKQDDWVSHTEDGLLTRRCAYWVSLRGAPKSSNNVTQTVYIPKSQPFSPAALRQILTKLSLREEVLYDS